MTMKEYHKIQTVYKRNPDNHYKTLLEGEFSLPEFEFLKNCSWTWTEKVDGTNIRVMWNGTIVSFGGKTSRSLIPANLVNHLQETFTRDAMVDAFGSLETNVCLYGEGYGAGIQKGGGNYSQKQQFVLFDAWITEWWLQRENVEDITTKLGIPVIPIIGEGTLFEMVENARGGFKSQWGDFLAEGIVARPSIELYSRSGHRIITKIKHKDFPKP